VKNPSPQIKEKGLLWYRVAENSSTNRKEERSMGTRTMLQPSVRGSSSLSVHWSTQRIRICSSDHAHAHTTLPLFYTPLLWLHHSSLRWYHRSHAWFPSSHTFASVPYTNACDLFIASPFARMVSIFTHLCLCFLNQCLRFIHSITARTHDFHLDTPLPLFSKPMLAIYSWHHRSHAWFPPLHTFASVF